MNLLNLLTTKPPTSIGGGSSPDSRTYSELTSDIMKLYVYPYKY